VCTICYRCARYTLQSGVYHLLPLCPEIQHKKHAVDNVPTMSQEHSTRNTLYIMHPRYESGTQHMENSVDNETSV